MTDREKNSFQLLPPLKRAELFQSHLKNDALSKTDISKRYNKSLSYVSNTMRLLTLPPIIKDGLASGAISEGHARALLTAGSNSLMVAIYRKILIDSISVREAEKLAREKRQPR